MSKPTQIAVAVTRNEHEQYGQAVFMVLTDDGKIYEGWGDDKWREMKGPWMETTDVPR